MLDASEQASKVSWDKSVAERILNRAVSWVKPSRTWPSIWEARSVQVGWKRKDWKWVVNLGGSLASRPGILIRGSMVTLFSESGSSHQLNTSMRKGIMSSKSSVKLKEDKRSSSHDFDLEFEQIEIAVLSIHWMHQTLRLFPGTLASAIQQYCHTLFLLILYREEWHAHGFVVL